MFRDSQELAFVPIASAHHFDGKLGDSNLVFEELKGCTKRVPLNRPERDSVVTLSTDACLEEYLG
jgi:hypothetical protein